MLFPNRDVPGISEPEHWPVFLLIWSCQQSPAGSLSALTGVYLPRGNSPYATTTPRAAKLVSHGLHSWPSNPSFLLGCSGHSRACSILCWFPQCRLWRGVWRLRKAQRGTHGLSFLSLHVHTGLVYLYSDTNTAFTESDGKHRAE